MNTQTKQPPMRPEQTIQVMQILCGALLSTVLIFSVIMFVVRKPVFDTSLFTESIKQAIHLVLFILGAVILITRIQIANNLFGKMLDDKKPENMQQVLPLYMTPFILRIALAEAAALMGFISTFISGEVSTFLILAAAAAIAIAKEFPTLKKVREKVKFVRPQLHILD